MVYVKFSLSELMGRIALQVRRTQRRAAPDSCPSCSCFGGLPALLFEVCLSFALLCGLTGCPGGPGAVGTQVCLTCHNGRLAPDRSEFPLSAHAAIGCETCHGPGYLHVRNGGRGGLLIQVPESDDALYGLCTQCHEREIEGHLESRHGASGALNCLDCHDVHSADRTISRHTNNSLCLTCHRQAGFATNAEIEEHTFHSVDPAGTGASRCTACHMVPLQRLDQAEGPHSHTMMPVPPIESNIAADAGVSPTPPNSCSGIAGCHDGTVLTSPVFDVDNPEHNEWLQIVYDARYGE